MNKEEIIKYLREKIKTNQDFIETIEKIGNDSSKTKNDIIINSQNDIKYYEEIINYIDEKDKIIDEILNHPFFTNECPYSSIGDGFVQELCDCDNCQEDYKKCWIKYFKNEILERGKNGK